MENKKQNHQEKKNLTRKKKIKNFKVGVTLNFLIFFKIVVLNH